TLIAKVKDLLSQAGTRTVAAPRAAGATTRFPPVAAPEPSAPPPPPEPPPAGAAHQGNSPGAGGQATVPAVDEPTFISDEPLEETPTMITPRPHEFARKAYEEPPIPPPEAADDLSYVDELPATDELMDVSPEESATLQGEPESDEMDDAPSPWAQPTIEVPLETRARAGREPSSGPEAAFDEVFEGEHPVGTSAGVTSGAAEAKGVQDDHDFGFARAQDVFASPAEPSPPSAAAPDTAVHHAPAPSAPFPEKKAPEPLSVEAPAEEDSSFASVAAASPAEAPAALSGAAEVGVPVDMVEKIAQRVVAQISEKVIREIAWEVIPDLAESLIKKEIDRLKAELQQT
ncbi:MAG TPA: hypothetical protein VMR21_00765, partial [Vicinamibacteria bacterium]|nr:hypothetical protein [Vicinamibacteria bacterium]